MASIKCGCCKGTHDSVAEVKDCYAAEADYIANAEAEVFADAVASWVTSGGSTADAQVYARVIASGKSWDEFLYERDAAMAAEIEAAGTCEHGLSAALCEGPQHYPMDN